MEKVPIRELRNQSSKVLARVVAGEIIQVTSNGVVQAVLVPPEMTPIERGLINGAMTPAKTTAPVSGIPRVKSPTPLATIIDDLKGDR
ncbi:type II toxin-antitoxin system prevent-host-death family antitoxin [Microlunatus elymi]|uniref:Antitoxin n=1 Tax=Microlunatus elymi TaxID=2596828 RepID=A0A516Q014_9ACTN|nr:type II toxin-antitoxin system prevent-host-death family antitoxin [Microlunatus elymi]QDP96758.1 type II toxin-antitoxin system prevent-host-death family antitoxin [Microlunatus elymi]